MFPHTQTESGVGHPKKAKQGQRQREPEPNLQKNIEMIFQVDGTPIKFFLQKDVPAEHLEYLSKAIHDHGGLVVEKVPIRGYVVINPGTPEADRLQVDWRDEVRPHRFFVPWSWVPASLDRGRLIPQVFVQCGYPIKIHIHRTIANVMTRGELMNTISLHGGDPNASFDDATVILASKETDAFKKMRKEYQGSSDKFIEDLKWLDTCIEQQRYFNTPNTSRNPGGRRAGDERMAFTEEDEMNLCNWIASVIPFKERGGRTGNKIYRDLVDKADKPGFEWVERHTWQSWRERYKKHSDRLDQHIAAIVSVRQANGSLPQDDAQFGFFKLTKDRQPRSSQKREASEEEARTEIEHVNGDGMLNGQDTQDSEWPIREGNGPVPDWAKRNVDATESDLQESKQQKMGDATFRTFVLAPAEGPSGPPGYSTGTEFAADFGQQPPLDPVEQEILAIARDQHFLADEVRAYYNRNGDLLATRQRFERIRALIDNLP